MLSSVSNCFCSFSISFEFWLKCTHISRISFDNGGFSRFPFPTKLPNSFPSVLPCLGFWSPYFPSLLLPFPLHFCKSCSRFSHHLRIVSCFWFRSVQVFHRWVWFCEFSDHCSFCLCSLSFLDNKVILCFLLLWMSNVKGNPTSQAHYLLVFLGLVPFFVSTFFSCKFLILGGLGVEKRLLCFFSEGFHSFALFSRNRLINALFSTSRGGRPLFPKWVFW